MKKNRTLLGVLLVIVSVALVAFGCGLISEWRGYQNNYFKILAERAPNVKPEMKIALQILRNDELQIADKCLTCHVAIDDPQMRREANPLMTHPGKYLIQHPAKRFGCTICHGGDGRSLSTEQAHGKEFRNGELVQISCAKCHQEEQLAGASNLSRGKALLRNYQCTGCHFIQGFSENERMAPMFTSIGSKVDEKWLVQWLKQPKGYLPNAKMPRYEIDEKYVDALAGYLMTFRDPEVERPIHRPEGDVEAGQALLRMSFCITCHPFNEKGGKEAPDLGRIGNKVNKQWANLMLKTPQLFQPHTAMPQYNFTDQQISDVVEHLFDEFTDFSWPAEDDTTVKVFWKDDAERVEIGRQVFKELRCANCHARAGEEQWIQVGPDLSGIGDKRIEEINFGHSNIPKTLPDYLFEKIRNPRAFATKDNLIKMPKYDISDIDAKDMTIALLSFNSDTVATMGYRVEKPTAVPYEPAGRFGELVEKFRCFSCHSFKGRGYNITYDLSVEGSRVTRKWLSDYLRLAYTIRPLLTIRMPIFNMTNEEVEALTDGMMSELMSADIPTGIEKELTPEMIDKGKALFERSGCLACHQLGDQGGYVGPSFTGGALIGDKLQAGWIFQWLKNPQAFVPAVLEPNYRFTDEEAKALTAYLMSLKTAKP